MGNIMARTEGSDSMSDLEDYRSCSLENIGSDSMSDLEDYRSCSLENIGSDSMSDLEDYRSCSLENISVKDIPASSGAKTTPSAALVLKDPPKKRSLRFRFSAKKKKESDPRLVSRLDDICCKEETVNSNFSHWKTKILSLLTFLSRPRSPSQLISGRRKSTSPQVFLSSGTNEKVFASRLECILSTIGSTTLSFSDELQGSTPMRAIARSSIWMPLISEDFMSTPYCLAQLQYMTNAWKLKPDKVFLPIFYGIKPSDIMLEKIPFKRAMSTFAISCSDTSKLEAWKEALKVAASVSSWVVSAPGSEEIVHLIAREVSSILHPELPHEGPYFVGIDRKVEQIMELLKVEVRDRRVVAICGIGGVGKTTLAKVIYSHLSASFEGCCFLPDIREKTQWKYHTFQDLQTELVSTILKRKSQDITSTDEGISYMREAFGDMKVLIVLDDVDATFNFEDLVGELDTIGPGSRIIVTSRYASDHLGENQIYEVPKLSRWEVHRLFSSYAYAEHPPFGKLATDIVSVIGAVPLVVEVIGSFLFGRGKPIWKETLQKLKDMPYEEVQKKLMISYEALDAARKQIYLDVASALNGEDKRVALYTWNDLSTSPFSGGKLRHFQSLVKIGDNNEFWMHDELRELGRQLICQGGYTELERENMTRTMPRGSGALMGTKGKEKVGALDTLSHSSLQYRETDNQDVRSIRFLNVNRRGTTAYHAYSNLRWLQLHRCPQDPNETKFPKSLVILDISWSNFTESWEGWGQIKMLKALKVLNLTGCNNLVMTPDFSGFPDLEILILEQCCRLVKIDPSISHLKMLLFLNLNFCSELSTLPKELGSMPALEELLVDGTCVQEIAIPIGHIKTLETLSASGCLSLNQLPTSIGYLESLLVLSLDHSRITEIPNAVKELKKLQKLSLRNCRMLGELPIAFGALEFCLRELDVSGTSISELPVSIGSLSSLTVLRVESCFIKEFPTTLLELRRLEEINASYCRSMSEFIPSYPEGYEVSGLEALKILRLKFSRISRLPTNFENLRRLEVLDVRHCDMLRELPRLPNSLTSLLYCCKGGMETTDLLLSDNLEEVFLSDSEPDELNNREIGSGGPKFAPDRPGTERHLMFLPRLRTLEIRLSTLTRMIPRFYDFSVRKLVLSCVSLNNLGELPPTLVSLSLQHCWSLEDLDVSQAIRLVELRLDDSAIREIRGLPKLQALEILKVSYCQKMEHLTGLEKLTSLRSLTVANCDRLTGLPDISDLTMLRDKEVPDFAR